MRYHWLLLLFAGRPSSRCVSTRGWWPSLVKTYMCSDCTLVVLLTLQSVCDIILTKHIKTLNKFCLFSKYLFTKIFECTGHIKQVQQIPNVLLPNLLSNLPPLYPPCMEYCDIVIIYCTVKCLTTPDSVTQPASEGHQDEGSAFSDELCYFVT